MLTQLKRTSIPLYVQIADLLRQRIARANARPPTQLPTIDELMHEFGVARVTVRQALDVLESEGLIARRRGKGTFVARPQADTRWLRLGTQLDELATMLTGTKPRLLRIADSVAVPPLTAKDGVPAPQYRYMKRVHSQAETPYCVIEIYLDARIFRRAPARFRRQTVIPVLRELSGVHIARAYQRLTIATADVETASLLKIPINSPIAEVRRVFCSPDGTVIYLGEVRYRGDFIHLEIDLIP
jgi:GntR family transcriptional regulator